MLYCMSGVSQETPAPDSAAPGGSELATEASDKPRYWAWADLMRRAFGLDVAAYDCRRVPLPVPPGREPAPSGT